MAEDTLKHFARKKAREACHEARDAFYKCLEDSGIHNWRKGDPVPSSCATCRKGYEGECPSSWVLHFDQTYSHNKAVSRFLDQNKQS